MTDKDGGSDMNSTPISKLPPPMISGDAPPLPQGASYQDILKTVELNRNIPSKIPMQQHQPPPQQMHPPAQMMHPQMDPEMMHQMHMQMQQHQQRQQQRHQPKKQQPSRESFDDDEPSSLKKRFNLKFLRPGLIVAAIVFLVLLKIAPMIATKLPFSIDSVTGKFTTAGLLIVSFLAGGTFLFVDETVKKYM